MGIFARSKTDEPQDTAPPVREVSPPSVLTASGVRIRPMAAEKMRAVAANRQPWQSLAWGYRDMIGELRFALRFRANALSRIQLMAAQLNPDDDQPIPLSLRHAVDDDGNPTDNAALVTLPPALCEAAEEELARLPLDAGYGFLGVWSENFDVAGECWLHGRTDPETGQEVWQVRSVDDVEVQGSRLSLRDELGQSREVDLDKEELYRLWVPHPRRLHLADSGLNAMMDVLEDITLIGRELRAVARSRIATNGVLLVPEGMVLLRNTREDDDTPPRERFMAEFTAGLVSPISNEGDAGAIAPMVLVGSIEDLEAFRHVTLHREDSPTLLAKLEKALGRMANSVDIPPEILTGMAEVNHWTAWQIDSSTFRHHLEPGVRLMVDALTESFLRAALIFRGFNPSDVARVRVWYDASSITENPNRRQDALDARDRAAISDDAFRAALGFGAGDAPSREEQLLMIAARQGIDQAAATTILAWAAQEDGADLPALPSGTSGTPNLPPGQVQRPAIAPAEPGTPETTPSAVAASALTAAAPEPTPYRLNTGLGRQLMEADRALRGQLLAAADAAIARALERSGSRLRAKATREPAVAASLKNVPVTEWPLQVGRTQALALGADVAFLLGAAWDELQGKFTRWVTASVADVAARVVAMLGLEGTSAGSRLADHISADMASRVDPSWSRLEAALNAYAERLMFDVPDEPGDEGEIPETAIPPHLIRTALAEVGGLPEESGGIDATGRPVGGEPLSGLGTGTAVTAVLDAAGVFTLGYLWVYGVTPMVRQFHPHRDLEGTRFTGWLDPKLDTGPRYAWLGDHFRPGDHTGCFVGETVVSGARPVVGYERPYVGEGVKVRTDAGHELTGTPNHPVLTRGGWVPLGELQEGDELVVATGREGATAVDQQYQQVPSRIDDVARTLPMAVSVATGPVPGTAEDFHDDGTDGEVTVVRTDSGLLADLEAAHVQLGSDDVLQFAGCAPSGLPAESIPQPFVHADGATSGGSVGAGESCASLLEGGSRVAVELGGGAPTPFDPEGIQPVENGLTVDPVPSAESLGAFAGQVALAEVVKIDRVALTGHVYNLSTLTGWYVANGIIASNCMCDYVPGYAVPDYKAGVREALSKPSQPTQDILNLAAGDDAAGRKGTTAQEVRDQWQAIQRLQSRFLNGE